MGSQGMSSREELADLIEIADDLQPIDLSRGKERRTDRRPEKLLIERVVHIVRDARQYAASQRVETHKERVENDQENDQCHKGWNALAWQNAVVNFQHEKRAGKIKNVHQRAGETNGEKSGLIFC
jgi:hypothetical protein